MVNLAQFFLNEKTNTTVYLDNINLLIESRSRKPVFDLFHDSGKTIQTASWLFVSKLWSNNTKTHNMGIN